MAGGNTTEAAVALQKPPSFRYVLACRVAPHLASLQERRISSLTGVSDGTMSNKMVEVIIGLENETESFVTYLDLLVYWVPWWDQILTENKPLRLHDENPRVFKVFLDWMLSDGHKLPQWNVHKHTNEVLESPKEVDENADIGECIRTYYRRQPEAEALDCYIFATENKIELFQNDLLDSILEMNPHNDLVPSYSIVEVAWDYLHSASPLRKYLTDVFARNWTTKTDIGRREELILRNRVPASFWISVLSEKDDHPEFLDDYPPWEQDLCQYHVHEETEKEHCYWQKINNGRGYSSDDSEDSDADMDEYEADFIDDDEPEVGSEDKSSTKRKLAEMMEEDSDASILSVTL